jgi:predicted nuclease of predicted toxin-antitoxin system
MNVLLDECLPRRLKYALPGHRVRTVPEAGWSGTKNGALIQSASADFDVFITADQNVRYQQNLRNASIAVIVLAASDNRFETLQPLVAEVSIRLQAIQPGEIVVVGSPT